ncbi:hypothetical protein [Galbibacter mesophilus]|uniref:hypothetical protein n=1 Tax=Galbibacter mesophilus TaxID=379069 RepID=UPI00191D98A2|nr:hypothetical protein [Galbibacter mesophilus]MCM5663146.1 hypothetical protein [Galbibacter mesophilus]
MEISNLPIQPHPFVSYLRVGRLLYLSLVLFVLESWVYWKFLEAALQEASLIVILFWSWCFLFSFIHIYLVLMDGWSRYQNYKRAKDQFFEYGFKERIADTYIGSKCQRIAAEVAAEELGIKKELTDHYISKGVKWYHYIPYFMLREPLFLFKKSFWSRTFLEKNYEAKHDFKNLQLESTV